MCVCVCVHEADAIYAKPGEKKAKAEMETVGYVWERDSTTTDRPTESHRRRSNAHRWPKIPAEGARATARPQVDRPLLDGTSNELPPGEMREKDVVTTYVTFHSSK